MVKIDKKIIGQEVIAPDEQAREEKSAAQQRKRIERPYRLRGSTYKIKPPTLSAALYLTVNDIQLPDGSWRPFEIFINTKDVTHHQWIVLTTRLVSAVFCKGEGFSFMFEEMREVQDVKGSYFLPGGKGMCGGVVSQLGMILEEHCRELGALPLAGAELSQEVRKELAQKKEKAQSMQLTGRLCVKCGEVSVFKLEGCDVCTSCGESSCG